jgi:hypothetical protein
MLSQVQPAMLPLVLQTAGAGAIKGHHRCYQPLTAVQPTADSTTAVLPVGVGCCKFGKNATSRATMLQAR